MRLPIRMKMFLLVMSILIGATSAVIFKTRSIFFEDKFDFVKQLSSKLSASSAKLVSERLAEYQNKLATFVSTRESLKKIRSRGGELNEILFEQQPEFLLVSLQSLKGSRWNTDWIQVNEKKPAARWTSSLPETLIRSLNLEAQPGVTDVHRISDSDGNVFFAISIFAEVRSPETNQVQKNIVIAFVDKDFLADAVVEYKGDLNSVFILDQDGYLVSHPEADEIGKVLSDDPVAKEIIEQKRKSATGEYKMKNGESIVASYQPVSRTNLLAVATTPMTSAMKAARDLMFTIFVFGLGFLVIGLVLAFVIASKITNPIGELQKSASQIGSGDFKAPVTITTGDEVGELAKSIDKMRMSLIERDEQIESSKMALVQSEKMSAFGQLSAGIAHEVKNPLAGILGHAQLAKSKVKDPDITKHMDVIEKEARRTKEIVENLMKFARAEKPEMVPTDIHETVSRTMDLVDHQLSLMGVKLFKHLDSVPQVMANGNQLQQVLLNLMMNAGHAMEEMKKKELHVYTEDKGEIIQIRVKDTGKGMTPEVKKKLFEPFFTTKPPGKGTGLGLSVSFGIVRDHKGKIYVEAEAGEGACFFIDLPKKDSNLNLSSTAPTPVSSPVKAEKSEKSSFEKAIDDFDTRRGIVTHSDLKTTTVPVLDSKFKKAVSDPDRLDDDKTDSKDHDNIMYSHISKEKTNLEIVKDPPKEEQEETAKIKEEKTEIEKIETTNVSPAENTGGESFKVKIRKPTLKA